MHVTKSTEYQNHPVIISDLDGLVGGGTIKKTPLSSTDELKPGAIVGLDSNNLLEVLKTAELYENEANDETEYKVLKGHEFKVGDFIVDSALTGAAYAITIVDTTTSEDYDILTVGTTLGHAMTEGECLVQATAEAAAGAAVMQVTPKGITRNSVDLSLANQPTGVMTVGSVNESLMPYPVDASVKALLPHIRFE